MTIRELLAKRTNIAAEMRSIVNAPAGEGGDLSAEQEARFATLKTELEGVEKSVSRQQLVDEAERRASGAPVGGTGDANLDTALRDFSLRRAILSQLPNATVDAGRERELSAELARREGRAFEGMAVPMSVFHRPVTQRDIERRVAISTANGAGDIIATELRPDLFVDVLRAKLVIGNAGATVLDGLVGNVDIPRLTGSVIAGWVGENSALSLSDQDFDKVSLSIKHVGCLSEYSRTMLLQSTPSIDALLRDDMARVLAQAMDQAALQGGGSHQPNGVLTECACPPVAATWTGVLDMIEALELANADDGNLSWISNPTVRRIFRATQKISGTDSVCIMQDPGSLAGYSFQASTISPDTGSADSALIFANWSSLLLGYWSVLDILVNPYESTAYSKGNVQVRAMLSADVQMRHLESFVCRAVSHPS